VAPKFLDNLHIPIYIYIYIYDLLKLAYFTVVPPVLKGKLGVEGVNIKVLEIKYIYGQTDIDCKGCVHYLLML
jgi:hypothetical protein